MTKETSLLPSPSTLFTPLKLRSITAKNRIVMSPMTRGFSPDGIPGENVMRYYRRRAEGQVGLIITEGVGVDHPSALGFGGVREGEVPVLHGQAPLSGWKRVVEAVHDAGGLIIPQLWHQGVIREPFTGRHPNANSMRPSGIWGSLGNSPLDAAYIDRVIQPTHPMTDEDIADAVAAFARSAGNAITGGFDGIAIHAAHGYLIDTFFWSDTNRRTDAYGGDARARARFGAEVVAAIRNAIGPELPIFLRFSQWKQQDFGARLAETPQELGELLGPLADAGVDVFDASTRKYGVAAFPGSPLTLAGWAKALTGKTSMAVGGIGLKSDLYEAIATGGSEADDLSGVTRRLDAGEFDLIGVGRSLIVDPDWPKKARNGEPFHPYSSRALKALI